MSDTDLGSLDAQFLARLFKSRDTSPIEATRAALERIARFNPAVNAYVYVDTDGAEAAASASTRRWSEGKPLSPIDGIPVSLKDLTQVAGMPCREGSLTSSDAFM